MNSSVFNWDDIDGSLRRNLGNDSAGWVDLASDYLSDMRRSALSPKDLPQFTQIKEKLGELRLYTCGNHKFQSTLKQITALSSKTCEKCGNSAQTQNLGGTLITLCCFCYNDELKGWQSHSSKHAAINIAEKFPALVSEDNAELIADIPPGWNHLLQQCCNRISGQLLRHQGKYEVEISAVSSENGELNLAFEKSHPDVDDVVSRYKALSMLTCVDCGYYGQIARGRHSDLGLCPSCLTLSSR